MCKLPYLHLFKQLIGNISSALDALLGKKQLCPLNSTYKRGTDHAHCEQAASARQTAEQKPQCSGSHKSFNTNVTKEMGFVHSLEAMRQEW